MFFSFLKSPGTVRIITRRMQTLHRSWDLYLGAGVIASYSPESRVDFVAMAVTSFARSWSILDFHFGVTLEQLLTVRSLPCLVKTDRARACVLKTVWNDVDMDAKAFGSLFDPEWVMPLVRSELDIDRVP